MATIPEALAIAIQHYRDGRLHAAQHVYRQILAVEPNQPDAIHLLGVIASRRGKHEVAVAYFRRAINVYGNASFFHNNLGEAYRALGKLCEAVACYRQALALDPDFAEAHYNLGITLQDQGELDEAVASYRRALELKPDYAEAHDNLGVALREQGRLDEAFACCRRTLELKPDDAGAHNNLGVALKEQGKLDEAVACYRRAMLLKPHVAEIHNNLGVALKEQGKLDEAVACCRRALELNPDSAESYSNLASALKDQYKLDEAIACCRRALELMPDFAGAHNNLGTAFEEQGKLDEALACYRRALELKPDFAEAHGNLGSVLVEIGDFQGAEESLRAALQYDSRLAFAHAKLAELLGGRLPQKDLAEQRRLLMETELTDAQRLLLHFGLAHVLDARGEHAEAAEHSSVANALRGAQWKLAGQQYDPVAHSEFVTAMIAEFTPEFFARVRDFGVPTERPVFIVGLPRSGTTLVEQILASHSQVFGAGELPLAQMPLPRSAGPGSRRGGTFPAWIAIASRRWRSRHLDALQRRNATALRVIDKMPDNYLYLGFLAAPFPRARFIHCRRDCRDVAVSCWFANFRMIRWANAPGTIAARFRDYQRLMERWRDGAAGADSRCSLRTDRDQPGTRWPAASWPGAAWNGNQRAWSSTRRSGRSERLAPSRSANRFSRRRWEGGNTTNNRWLRCWPRFLAESNHSWGFPRRRRRHAPVPEFVCKFDSGNYNYNLTASCVLPGSMLCVAQSVVRLDGESRLTLPGMPVRMPKEADRNAWRS